MYIHICFYRYNYKKVWIGFNKEYGKLDCDEPEDCLTKCYSKPKQKEVCENPVDVYLQCGKDDYIK